MNKYLVIIFLCIFTNTQANEYKGDTGFLSDQMAEWCTGESRLQNFCTGFLLGVYENSSCLTSQTTPDWEELKKVYLGWVYTKGDKVLVSASVSAMLAFNEKYGCKSYLLDYMNKN